MTRVYPPERTPEEAWPHRRGSRAFSRASEPYSPSIDLLERYTPENGNAWHSRPQTSEGMGNVWQWTDEFQDAHTRAAILKGGRLL